MPTVKLNGLECNTVEKWNILKQWNDGNLPARIECWLNSSGYLADPEVIEWDAADFDDDDTDEDAGWETDFTPSANLYALIATKSTRKCLHVYDYDLDEIVKSVLVFTTPLKYTNPSPSNIFSFDIAIQKTGTYAALCYSYYTLIDHAGDEWLYLRVDHENGKFYYSFDNAAWTDTTVVTGFTLSDEAFITIEIQVTAANKFKYNIDDVGWSSEITNDNTYDTSLDSFRVETAVGNYITTPESGYETFAGLDEDVSVDDYEGEIGTFNIAAGTATALGHVDGTNHVLEIVDDTDAESITLELPFDSSGSINGTDYFEFKLKVVSHSGTNLFYPVLYEGATVRIQLQFQNGGDIYYYAGSFQDTGLNFDVGGGWTTIRILFFSQTKFKLSVDGGSTWSGELTVHNGGWSGTGALCSQFKVIHSGDGQSTTYWDDLKASWLLVAGSDVIYPVEAWLDEISVDFNVGVNLANVRGALATIFNDDDELIWKGYVDEYNKQIYEGDADIMLICFDEFYHMARHDIDVSNILHVGKLNGNPAADNEFTIEPALPITESDTVGSFITIKHAAGTVTYDGGANAAMVPSDAAFDGNCTEHANTEANLVANDGDTHAVKVYALWEKQDRHGYVEYDIDRASESDEIPERATLRIEGTLDVIQSPLLFRTDELYAEAYDYLATEWVKVASIYRTPDPWAHYGEKISVSVSFSASRFIQDSGGNWNAKIRIREDTGGAAVLWLGFYIDRLVIELVTKKTIAYLPVEGHIDTRDSTTVISVNTIPFVEDICDDDDVFVISRGVKGAVARVIRDLKIPLNIDESYGGVASDERGNDGFSAFNRMMSRLGIDYFIDYDDDDEGNVIQARNGKTFFDCVGIATAVEAQNISGWGRYATEDYRVTVGRSDALGSYLSFKHLYPSQVHDTVYKLIAPDLDTAPARTLKSAEFYFSTAGFAVDDAALFYIKFPGTSTADSGPLLKLTLTKDLVGFNFYLQAFGNSGNSDEEIIPIDANGCFAVKIEFDYDANTLTAYYKNVESGIMLDSWTDVGNCANCTVTENPARAITFDAIDPSNTAAAIYVYLHGMRVDYQLDEFDGGAITAGGDVTIQKKADAIASLLVIGGKDYDGEEVIMEALDSDGVFDPDGKRMVVMQPGMTSQDEIRRYILMFMDKYAADLNAIRMANYIDNTTAFKAGYYYQFTLDSVNYDEILRRAEASWDNKSKAIRWTLEFGKGRTFGRERLFRAGHRNDAAINELRLR